MSKMGARRRACLTAGGEGFFALVGGAIKVVDAGSTEKLIAWRLGMIVSLIDRLCDHIPVAHCATGTRGRSDHMVR